MIYIVIPVFNRLEFTINCLKSLRNQSYKDYKTILIDDGSTDGTSEYVKKNFPDVEIILGDGNLWWTKSTNLGVKKAQEDDASFVLTLNNDTIAPIDFLEKMIEAAQLKQNSVIGTSAIDTSGNRIFSGERINWLKGKPYRIKNDNNATGLIEVTHFPGRGLLIPKEVFKKIGYFDEKNFPQYLADIDFTHRARNAGFKIYCNLDSKLVIYPEASGDKENRAKKSLKNYYNHLFGMTGGASIIKFIVFAWKNCPKLYIISYLVIGTSRRLFGYWLK